MIKLSRVDHRLIHGQVAFSWSKFLGIDLILIPSDSIVHDNLRISMLRIAKPDNMKLIIKNIAESVEAINTGKTDKYKMMILFESVEDAYRLLSQCPSIKELNLGGMKNSSERRQISKAVHLSDTDIKNITELVENGVDVTVQLVPDDDKMQIMSLL